MQINQMVYWITAREQMRKHKEAGGKFPHHHDPIMYGNRYTNVRREHDKVTKWLSANWRHVGKDLTRLMALARMVNYIPSLKEIGADTKEWDSDLFKEVLWGRIDRKEKTWSSAYMITTCGKKMDKVEYVVDHVCENVKEVEMLPTLAAAYTQLRRTDGVGSFLAGQIIADLKNTPGTALSVAEDFQTWSSPGPGSLRGLSHFFGYDVTETTYHRHIKLAWDVVKPLLPPELRDLHMQDFQNCFCELSKYVRGYGRNSYKG